MKPRHHRWGIRIEYPLAHKTERECTNGCGITMVTRHENDGGRDVHWEEFWRGGEQVHGDGRPICDAEAGK